MKYRGLTAQQAQAKLIEARPHINPHLAERPVVREFAKRLSPEPSSIQDE
jgi:hypothetical protein